MNNNYKDRDELIRLKAEKCIYQKALNNIIRNRTKNEELNHDSIWLMQQLVTEHLLEGTIYE